MAAKKKTTKRKTTKRKAKPKLSIAQHRTRPRVSRSQRLRDYIRSLSDDEAVPVEQLCKDFDLLRENVSRIVKELDARIVLVIDGRSVSCAANPEVVEKHYEKQKEKNKN